LQSVGIEDGDELLTTLEDEKKKKKDTSKRVIEVTVVNNTRNQYSLLSWYDDAHNDKHKAKLFFSRNVFGLIQELSKDRVKNNRYKKGIAKRSNSSKISPVLALGSNLAGAETVEFPDVIFELNVPEEK